MKHAPPKLAEALEEVHAAAKKLAHSGLSRRAVVLLLADEARLGKKQVEKVLDAVLRLDATVLDPSDWGDAGSIDDD